jgi:putative molybdopterin biosynthesis protein
MVIEAGGTPKIYSPVDDHPDSLREAIVKGVADNDMLLINAGSSAGSKDYTVKIIKELGQVIVHGIAIKPGKPTILGVIQQKCVIGIPGYPVSAYFSFETFVKPIIEQYSGISSQTENCEAYLSQRVNSSLKHEELVRVTLGEINGRYIATPLNRGAGNTMSLVKADGVLTIPRHYEGIENGTKVNIRLLKPISNISRRLVIIGSHDIILDVISDLMPITSGHVGSLGGIMAMKKEECHIAPIHLLNEEDGTYNDSYVTKYFEPGTMAIISGVKRLQGLMVQKDNPKNIQTFQDLIRDDVSFVNRQRGSGTRQLLDFELKANKINHEKIDGYQREMNTHMAVAATVSSKGADVALGTFSAAKAMDLDFVPVGYEAYEFLVRKKFLEDSRVLRFISTLQSEGFIKTLDHIGGYKLEDVGNIRIVGEVID